MWIARDKDGYLYLYIDKPILCEDKFTANMLGNPDLTRIDENWFQEVTFENSPQEVELKIINNESK